ncbi:flavodoxin family protein [Caenimonas aquaedulcis]|uniref:Flavodoxin family protein n=1 Tax=Caenimonas aquaedulcis TaxID=2793270 RepID=A0A931MIJ3_9BURK|nr:flavodoxin family protein [Caenimonas aquaedulcis]MBG9390047.1 flavodoxin family protein [Caenimonas aquaedulcis]
MGSTLIVFYSLTGNSRRLGQLLAAQTGWPVGEVLEERPRTAGASGYLRCAVDSLFHRSPEVRYQGPEPSDFANVVLVAPIWAGRIAGPMRSFARAYGSRLQRIALLTTMGGRGGSNAVAEIGRVAGRDPVLAEVVTAQEVQDGSCAQAVEAFAKAVERSAPGEPVRPAVWSPAS